MSRIRAVIFDMDGVIVASGRLHAESWRLLARKRRQVVTDEQFRGSFGQTNREIIRAWWGASLPDAAVAELDHEKERIYRELIAGVVPLTVGVREALWRLQEAGFRLGLGTSGPRANVDLVLDECGMRGFFSAIATGDDVQRGKPAPDIFLLAARTLQTDPAHCTVIEDAPVGISAALAADMRAIGFVGTYPPEALLGAGAHDVVSGMSELTADRVVHGRLSAAG